MSYVEMTIDSLRHAMHKDEWLILLKDKAGERYLPVYVDKAWADMVGKVMKGEVFEEVIDAEIEGALAMGNEVRLLIDDTGDGRFKARFVGRGDGSFDIECPVGDGLAMAMKAGVDIIVERKVLTNSNNRL